MPYTFACEAGKGGIWKLAFGWNLNSYHMIGFSSFSAMGPRVYYTALREMATGKRGREFCCQCAILISRVDECDTGGTLTLPISEVELLSVFFACR